MNNPVFLLSLLDSTDFYENVSVGYPTQMIVVGCASTHEARAIAASKVPVDPTGSNPNPWFDPSLVSVRQITNKEALIHSIKE